MAALWRLPVIYVCENNAYAEFTATSESTSVPDISVRAQAYGIPGVTVDGNDVLAVYEAARAAVGRAREGKGPTLIEAKTYRWEGHVVGEQAFIPDYRSREEVEQAQQRCPIERFRKELLATGFVSEAELERIRGEVEHDLDDAVRYAQESPFPALEEAARDVFAA